MHPNNTHFPVLPSLPAHPCDLSSKKEEKRKRERKKRKWKKRRKRNKKKRKRMKNYCRSNLCCPSTPIGQPLRENWNLPIHTSTRSLFSVTMWSLCMSFLCPPVQLTWKPPPRAGYTTIEKWKFCDVPHSKEYMGVNGLFGILMLKFMALDIKRLKASVQLIFWHHFEVFKLYIRVPLTLNFLRA